MTPAEAHLWVRLLLIGAFALIATLLTWQMIVGLVADYGWPWRPKPGANGRRTLDSRVTLYMAIFALLAVTALVNYATALDEGLVLPPTRYTVGTSLIVAVLDALLFDIYRVSRRERQR